MMRETLLAVEYMRKDKGGNGGLIINVASGAGMYYFNDLALSTHTDKFLHFPSYTVKPVLSNHPKNTQNWFLKPIIA